MTTATRTSLDDLISIKPKVEYLRLKSLEVAVPTDEQRAKAAATSARNNTFLPKPRATLRVVWEPLSYNIKGNNGNVTTDYLEVSWNLEDDDLPRIRANGWLGIPDRKLIRMDDKLAAEAQKNAWPRYRARTRDVLPIDIDIDGSVTGKVGQPYSSAIGHVFEVTEGYDNFPRNVNINDKWVEDKENPRRVFMRYPVRMADDYVAPADVPIRVAPVRAESDAGTVVDTDAIRTANTDSLRAAAVDSGMVGMLASDLSGVSKQINFLNRHMEDSAATVIFGTAALNEAANNGELLTLFLDKGAISVDDAGIIR